MVAEAGRGKGAEEPGKLTERKAERNGPGRLTHSLQMEHSVTHLGKIGPRGYVLLDEVVSGENTR